MKLLMNQHQQYDNLLSTDPETGFKPHAVDRGRHDALKNICREKDRALVYYINLTANLKREINRHKAPKTSDLPFFEKMNGMIERLQKSQDQNSELKNVINYLKRITTEQAKAL